MSSTYNHLANLQKIFWLSAFISVAGCAQISKIPSPGLSTSPGISLSVSPNMASVQTAESEQFVASVENDTKNMGVTWSLVQAGSPCSPKCGAVSAATPFKATYVAPNTIPSPAVATLVATSLADSAKSVSVQITVTSQALLPISVAISPSVDSVQISQATQFSASVQNDTNNEGVTWSLNQAGNGCTPGCGTLSAGNNAVLYTAPATVPIPNSVTLLATSVADRTKSASAQITVSAPSSSSISVSIAPAMTSVQTNQTQQFFAAVQNDSQNKGVTWSLTQSGKSCSPTCGSLPGSSSNSAIFNAPGQLPYPAVVNLSATSISDSTKSASATIAITAPAQGNTSAGGWFNIADYGGRALEFPANVGNCSIVAGSNTLNCQSVMDWENGDGIRVDEAGPLTSIATPSGVTVTPMGIANGSTTYSYQIVAEDYNGSLTAASPAGITYNGAATLGVNSVDLVGCTLASNGQTTYTTSSPDNFVAGTEVWVSGNPDFTRCDGVMTIASTPSPTTFISDIYDIIASPGTGIGGEAQVLAGNKVVWTTPVLADQVKIIRYWIYRNGVLIGVAQGNDAYYEDYDYGLGFVPSYVQQTPPTNPTPGWLSSTITAGAGTNLLTLANAATSTVTKQSSYHDNAPALLGAIHAAQAQGGGNVLIPPMGDSTSVYLFTTNVQLPGGGYLRILLGGGVMLYESWILNSGYTVQGQAGSGSFDQSAFFGTGNYAFVGGFAYPLFYSTCKQGVDLQSLLLQPNQNQQWGLLVEGNSTCGSVNFGYQDFYSAPNGFGGVAEVIRGGGFGHYYLRGGLLTGKGGGLAQEALQIVSSQNQGAQGGLTGMITIDQTVFSGKGVRIFNGPGGGTAWGGGGIVVQNVTFENTAGPLVRINSSGNLVSGWQFDNDYMCDTTVGLATPMIDMSDGTNLQYVDMLNLGQASDNPIFAGETAGSLVGTFNNVGTPNLGLWGNGYTYTGPGNIQNNLIQSVSASPTYMKELNQAPQGVPGQDVIWANANSHTLDANINGTGVQTIATTADIDATWNVSFPGALTSTTTASTWTPDQPITVTRVQAQLLTPPDTCATNAVITVTDGRNEQALVVSAAANDSGTLSQNFAAGTPLTVHVSTPAAGCSAVPATANVVVQYHVQSQ